MMADSGVSKVAPAFPGFSLRDRTPDVFTVVDSGGDRVGGERDVHKGNCLVGVSKVL